MTKSTLLVDLLRQLRQTQIEGDDNRDLYLASIALNAEQAATISRRDETIVHLRAQVRAVMAGTTIQEELRKLGRAEVEPEYEAVEHELQQSEVA